MTSRPSLRLQLLFRLVFLASAAVVLVGLITLLLTGSDPSDLVAPLAAFWLGSTAVLVLFGAYLMNRYILEPVAALGAEADALAAGLPGAAGEYESHELAALAERYRAMAESLLDAQSQIVRAEKLAGIGRLAAGVAHEVRNPLGAIGAYVDVLRQRGVDAAVLDEMRQAIGRIDRIVESLLDYSRPERAPGTADPGSALRTAADFLAAQGALRGHKLELEVEPAVPAVRAEPHALEQVALNLLLNARDAAPGARIWAGVRAHRLEGEHRGTARAGETNGHRISRDYVSRPRRRDLPPGTEGALLFVADDGPGVAESDRERVFDPFFTTKDPGKGTGLGLAIVARTVDEAGGIVWVDRAREGGAAFKIFLPALNTAAT